MSRCIAFWQKKHFWKLPLGFKSYDLICVGQLCALLKKIRQVYFLLELLLLQLVPVDFNLFHAGLLGSCHGHAPLVSCPMTSLIPHHGILLCTYKYTTPKFRGINSYLSHPWPMGEKSRYIPLFHLLSPGHFWNKAPWKVMVDQVLAAHSKGQVNNRRLCFLSVLLFLSCSLVP